MGHTKSSLNNINILPTILITIEFNQKNQEKAPKPCSSTA